MTRPSATLWALAARGCGRPTPSPPPAAQDGEVRPNIVFVDIDTWRADRLLAERGGRPIAPTIAALAQRGFVFEHAFTQGGWTMPGLASLLSGHWPVAMRARDFDLGWLPPDAQLLPEILAMYGYHTVFYGNEALVSTSVVTGHFQTVLPPSEGQQRWVAPLSTWIETRGQEPFFAFLGDVDLHMPRPPLQEPLAHRFSGPTPACAPGTPQSPQPIYESVLGALGPERARQHAIDHYDAGLAAYDDALAGLVQVLAARGLADHTMIVLTSNHGEELGEHGSFSHGLHYDTVLHIPLVVMDPRRAPTPGAPPRVLDPMVQAVDLAPTLLDLAGVPVDRRMDGRSLKALMDGDPAGYAERDVFSLSDEATASVRTPTAKLLIHRVRDLPEVVRAQLSGPAADADTREEYYLLDPDPGERTNLADARPEEAAALRARLDAWLGERTRLSGGGSIFSLPDSALVDRLKRDGYWKHVGQGPPPPPGTRPPPPPP